MVERRGKRTFITIPSSSSSSEDEGEEYDNVEAEEAEDDYDNDENDEEDEEGDDSSDDGTIVSISSGDGCDSGDEEEDELDNQEGSDNDDLDGDDESLCNRVIRFLQERNDLQALNLKDCKAYLRKHGLRITGTKSVCIQRIKEHWRLKDGNGETLYPRSSFSINCTGDVCKGDAVLFTQKVYEKFDKVTRSGRVIGKRSVAGRVVKESYGATKQQHTFTVEILWCKGTKKLSPLVPLLVKGRNLYKLKTYRQRWKNEAERSKVLDEKHKRGAAARRVRAMKKTNKTWTANKGAKRQKNFHHEGPSRRRHTSEVVREKHVSSRHITNSQMPRPSQSYHGHVQRFDQSQMGSYHNSVPSRFSRYEMSPSSTMSRIHPCSIYAAGPSMRLPPFSSYGNSYLPPGQGRQGVFNYSYDNHHSYSDLSYNYGQRMDRFPDVMNIDRPFQTFPSSGARNGRFGDGRR